MINLEPEGRPYPHSASDIDPLPAGLKNKGLTAHLNILRDYYLEVLLAYKKTKLRGELFFADIYYVIQATYDPKLDIRIDHGMV